MVTSRSTRPVSVGGRATSPSSCSCQATGRSGKTRAGGTDPAQPKARLAHNTADAIAADAAGHRRSPGRTTVASRTVCCGKSARVFSDALDNLRAAPGERRRPAAATFPVTQLSLRHRQTKRDPAVTTPRAARALGWHGSCSTPRAETLNHSGGGDEDSKGRADGRGGDDDGWRGRSPRSSRPRRWSRAVVAASRRKRAPRPVRRAPALPPRPRASPVVPPRRCRRAPR